jgi:YD repeat-containing protein
MTVATKRFAMSKIDLMVLNLLRAVLRILVAVVAMMVLVPVAQAGQRQPAEGYHWQGKLYQSAETVADVACTTGNGPQSPGYDHIDRPTDGGNYITVYCKIYYSDRTTYPEYLGRFPWVRACPDSSSTTDGAISGPTADEKKPECSCDGNPISLGAKSKIQAEKDYSTEHGLEFTRHYSSLNAGSSPEMLTRYWRHSYSKRLFSSAISPLVRKRPGVFTFTSGRWYPQDYPAPPGKNAARIYDASGYGVYFESDGAGGWVADPDVKARLVSSAPDAQGVIHEWTLYRDDDSVEKYNVVGQLVSQRFRSGNERTLTYSIEPILVPGESAQEGLLIEVRDNFGASLQFRYDTDRRMSKMIDAAGQEYSYAYMGDVLESVTRPDGLKVVYHYNEPAYVTGSLTGLLLTGISREISPSNIVRYATFKYENSLPISTEHAGGVEKYSFNYGNNTVTDPLETVRSQYFAEVQGRKMQYMMVQPGGKGVPAANNYRTFDVNGNIDFIFDFNANKTCYKYDLSRNLEVARVEGLRQSDSCTEAFSATALTVESRKISTQWHAAFRIPVGKAEPKLRTKLEYDAAGNLSTKTLQATSDLTGALGFNATLVGSPRIWKYTYNDVGQLLTEVGPRTDVVAKTSYTYDAQGNLRTITNAAGQITTLSNYDPHGHVGRIEDANGLATTFEYTPRGLLAMRNVSGAGVNETTTFRYDGAGQLREVVMPDLSAVYYTYDDAGRLTDVVDKAGNKIHYTLDNMGNRLKEEVSDTGGVLARQTARIYNNLNRLEQVTGAAQ